MKITKTNIKIKELVKNYIDDGDGGVFAYNNKLIVRPAYQREFIYNDKQRNEVINTVRKGFPLNIMYWSLNKDGTYELLDGQQRTISICQYVNKDFSIDHRYWHNLLEKEQKQFLDYTLDIYICEGTEEEKLAWFRVVNIAGAVLTDQELLNAMYTGTWLADAKKYFSKRTCVASQMSDGYLKGNPIRQELLSKVLGWIADRDGLKDGQEYMAIHQKDLDANDLWMYFQSVINWAKMLFPNVKKGITDSQDWGLLYNKYKNNTYNSNILKEEMDKLILDDDVTKNSGIIPYLLSDRTILDEKYLSIRGFTEEQKRRKYEEQKGICLNCKKHFEYEEMHGDHIVPWSKGGKTIDTNLQMLCQACNNDKSNK